MGTACCWGRALTVQHFVQRVAQRLQQVSVKLFEHRPSLPLLPLLLSLGNRPAAAAAAGARSKGSGSEVSSGGRRLRLRGREG